MTDTITIDVDREVELPLAEVLAGRGFITGKSGSGKSTSAGVIVEEVLDRGRPVLIVDTDGEYWGLKQEYQLLHVGADEEADHQVGPEHAEWLAEKALYDGIPVILDVSGYIDSDEVDRIVHDVLHHLFVKEKEARLPFLVLIEEIHEYVPQSGSFGDVGDMVVQVAKRGRKRGLGVCGLSQRPASVDKDFITQCDWILWHRLTWDNDTAVVRTVVDSETAEEVKNLDDGEGFLTADFLDERVVRIQVRAKRTVDLADTPDLEGFERPELKSIGEDLSEELEEISKRQQQRQDEIERLKGVIESKEAAIESLEGELERERIATSTAERIANAMAGGSDEDVQEKIEEIREEKNEEIRQLQTEREELAAKAESRLEELRSLKSRVEELEERAAIDANIDELEEAVARMSEALGLDVGGGDEKLRERLRERDDRIDELERDLARAQSRSGGIDLGEFEDYEEFLSHEAVRDAIEDAKEQVTPRYVKGVLAAIVDEGGPVTYDDIAGRLDLSQTKSVSKAATRLENRGIVKKDKSGDGRMTVDLNIGGIEDVIRAREKQERTSNLMEQF